MNILLTGEKGYIANNIAEYIYSRNGPFNILQKSIRYNSLDKLTLNKIETVIHAAALVHKKETPESEAAYFEINMELTIKLALKAKKAGVKQFIFLSTMAVYGNVRGAITKDTKTYPVTYYGKSKLAAEEILLEMQDRNFKVAIVRPPMVYGPSCPGNYVLLSKLSSKIPIFPQIVNKRSMLFIDNLSEFIFQLIKYEESGIFHPQDSQYITTSVMVKKIAKANNKYIYFSKLAGKILNMFMGNKAIYQKVFGDLYYTEELSDYRDNSYQRYNLEQAIAITEKKK
ncbi:NAD-dependent epimerase/dehydratase family protein [Lysinibacillus capsici]|uniref:NAD-dependent epimerase/dehydratase family protein n=1 Tax=Lysinibacillus capsici TaxID=2115968 RepID=UPI001C10FF73|nr:NAD-dependent epimerase/dehydratase family protein [Lysinibacillus capsici]MBU5250749.1 NAD-dependent epimerase/dehydratase family protein [Lysinibacillus capsici]